MQERYTRNIPSISEEEQLRLAEKSVLVVGCGGLGGYIVEELARLGVGEITACDGDVFCESNLNRQLFSSVSDLGRSKVEAAAERISKVNPDIVFVGFDEFLTPEQIAEEARDCDLVLDALDSVADRLVLEDICEEAEVPLVHGAVKGWNLQVAVSAPGSGTLHKIYGNVGGNGDCAGHETCDHKEDRDSDNSADKTCICPTPAICASMQVVEALKILIGQVASLEGKLLCMDLKSLESYTIEI